MPNQKLEKSALVTTMSQFLLLPVVWQQQPKVAKILLPSARHLEEGRRMTIFELPRL